MISPAVFELRRQEAEGRGVPVPQVDPKIGGSAAPGGRQNGQDVHLFSTARRTFWMIGGTGSCNRWRCSSSHLERSAVMRTPSSSGYVFASASNANHSASLVLFIESPRAHDPLKRMN